MLEALYRHRILFAIFLFIILAALIWLLIMAQGGNRVPSGGVFI